MATKSMNLVDAVAETIPRLARNRSAVLRFGTVATAPANGMVKVNVANSSVTCPYLQSAAMAVGDWVALINDGDRWLALGPSGGPAEDRDLGYTVQSSSPTFSTAGWTDFTTGQWARPVFTMPKTGRVMVNLSASVANQTDGAVTACGYRLSPTSATTVMGMYGGALHVQGGYIKATKLSIVNGTPGVVYTVVPQWTVNQGPTTAYINEGVLHITAGG